jgi:hypothetical protein
MVASNMGARLPSGRSRRRRGVPAPVFVEETQASSDSGVSPQDVDWMYRELLDRHAIPAEVEHHCRWSATLRDLVAAVLSTEERRLYVSAHRDLAARAFVDNLQLLNDTLAGTALSGRYWVWGGLLIGWAREGRPLRDDCADADFAFRREDMPAFAAGAGALIAIGFEPLFRHVNNAGHATEYTFWRDGAKFEFFLMDPVDTRLLYYNFGAGTQGEGPVEAVAAVTAQPLVTFEFLGRTWCKHADHDAELSAMYGDWRRPDPGWNYMDDRATISRTTWTRPGERAWTGAFGDSGDS